jgi:membrane-bound lytic murein transglycosylase D
MLMRKKLNRNILLGSAVLVLSLQGCAPSKPASSPAATKPQATAPALPPAPATPSAAAPSVADLETQKVNALIAQVDKVYAQGEADYRKGNLSEAKVEFDRAIDFMLTSSIGIKNNSKLEDEFNRIVDAVNGLEMEALKEGNGFVPKEEPTPADVASDVTFEVDPNIVAKAKADLATTKSDLPLMVNDYVAVYINFFANTQKGHNTLLHAFQRAGRYKAMIQRVMAEEGVPQDMIYLAVAESGFNPRALNPHSHAGGMWQFMPSGNYGLARNAYVDERFDPEKSTRASARYMRFIYDELGDWYLAMAGYNWGTGNVQRAVVKTGYADFWELYKRNNLPAETKNYVPEILAAIIIANHPTQYGFDEVTLDPPVITDTVTVNYPITLRLVSDIVKAPLDELSALNPSLLRMMTPPEASFDLHLPAGTGTLFEKQIALIPENKRNAWRYRRLSTGDTLASVAKEYHVAAWDLAEANQMQESDSLDGKEALVVPAAPAVAVIATRAQVYTVRKGETLVTIADRFGVSLDQLRKWNNISGIKVNPGRRLRVAETATASRSTRGRHRGSATRSSDDSSAKARKSSRSEDSTTKSSRSASKKKGSAITRSRKGAAAKDQHAESSKAATSAKKSGTDNKRKHSTTRTRTKNKSSK